ncbi:MAG TPA: selenium-dependent molybdenum cofactor biosynthesis protein YqeB [Aggregatilineales bacterium]|nr:selenium-dependent molybdenum cofactor biosynthesis protein YqeB [Aggregatilineales bacterium]
MASSDGESLILIRGAGDLASGAAYRLVKAGFPVVMTDLAEPLFVRTTVSYGSCLLYWTVIIEGIVARPAPLEAAAIRETLTDGVIVVVVDPGKAAIDVLHPAAVIDARLAKINLDTQITDAPLVIGLGPGFVAGVDCHAVVETNRGHNLGRVHWRGCAEPDTGMPGSVGGRTSDRVLRAPVTGYISPFVNIGEFVSKGRLIARVGDQPVIAPFDGVLRGLIDYANELPAGMKIGDIDPRAERKHCFTISDKSLAVGGGVVEAIMSSGIFPQPVPSRGSS